MHPAGAAPTETGRRKRGQGNPIAVGLALSALVHAVVLLYGHYTVPPTPDSSSRTAPLTTAEPDLRLVVLAPEPVLPETSPAVVASPGGTPEPLPSPAAPGPASGAALLDIPALSPAAMGELAAPQGQGGDSPIPTFDLKATAHAPPATMGAAAEATVKKPGFFKRLLGGLINGASVAIQIPCGPNGSPGGTGIGGGIPVVPDGAGMPGMPGVTGGGGMAGLPGMGGTSGVPTPGTGVPTVPDPTIPATVGPVAGTPTGPKTGGLIGCSNTGGTLGGGGGRIGGGLGGIFGVGGKSGRPKPMIIP